MTPWQGFGPLRTRSGEIVIIRTMAETAASWDATGGEVDVRTSEIVVPVCALLALLAAQWILCSTIPGSNYYPPDGKLA